VLSAIGTILDSLIAFRIVFALVKEVNLLPSKHYILQQSLLTIISGSKNVSSKELHTPLCNILYLYLECPESASNMLLSDPSSDMETLESSDRFSTWQYTLSLDLSNSVSKLSLSVSNSGSIVSKSLTSTLFPTPQQVLSLELSDSNSVLSFLTFGSGPRILESLGKLESLVDSLSGLGSNLSSESLF